jgi:hypothetical protein
VAGPVHPTGHDGAHIDVLAADDPTLVAELIITARQPRNSTPTASKETTS